MLSICDAHTESCMHHDGLEACKVPVCAYIQVQRHAYTCKAICDRELCVQRIRALEGEKQAVSSACTYVCMCMYILMYECMNVCIYVYV